MPGERPPTAEVPLQTSRRSKSAWPFSHYQLALVLLAVLPLIVAFSLMAWWQSQSLRDSIDRGMLRTADTLSLAIDREMGIIRASLETLADSDALDHGDIPGFHAEAVRLASRHRGSWINLIEPSGQQLVNTSLAPSELLPKRLLALTDTRNPDELPVGATAYVHKVFATGQANNSQLFMSIAQKTPVVAISVPVSREGTVRYVLSISFPPDGLTELLLAGLYDKKGGAALVDAHGFVITRSQQPEQFIGKKASAALTVAAEAPARGVGTGTTLDGETLYRAYSRSPITGWVVSNGMVRADLDAAVEADLSHTVLVGTLGLLAGIFLALLFANRLRLPMKALADKASGKNAGAAPRGFMPAEFIEIGRAIDAGHRAREAEATERDLRVAAEARKEEADAANRAKDRFLAMLGHELRNPLAAINNAVAVMEQAPAATTSMTPIVKRQSEHLRKLVDDLLDVARVTSGKIRLMPENTDLYALAAACVDNFVRTGRSAHHHLTVSGESVFVFADPHRMTQVLTNLLDNALKFTPAGGRIAVHVAADGPRAVLRVEDTGIGITREALSRIFDVFAQGDELPDRAHSGLGLGLALAKSLVEAQYGHIAAESSGPGKGAVFTLTLTRVQDDARTIEPDADDPATVIEKKRVLLVEDQADTRRALRGLLELDGHEVTEATDGATAIQKARASPPQVALIDIGLPDIDGFQVARVFRNDPALCGILLVALTGYGLPEDREKAMQAGFDAFVVKPIELMTLRQTLQA